MSANFFRIAETESFQENIRKCLGPKASVIYLKILNQVYPQLRNQPFYGRNIKKLKSYRPEAWRYRIGDYRIIYHINTELKLVIPYAFSLRKDAYI